MSSHKGKGGKASKGSGGKGRPSPMADVAAKNPLAYGAK
jgi:hypothetical protein